MTILKPGSGGQVLKLGGAEIAVTNENKLQYVHLAADWHLQRRLAEPARVFAQGLTQVTAAQIVTLSVVPMSYGSWAGDFGCKLSAWTRSKHKAPDDNL